jgi:hypothetical protein
MVIQQDIKYAEETNEYFNSMIYQEELLIEDYNKLLQVLAKSGHNENILNAVLSRAVVIATQLIVKLEGCGARGADLLKEFEQYKSWKKNLIIIKSEETEIEKLPDLIELILRAYDKLGYTN